MALNKKTFYTRTLSAVVFVIIMLVGLFWNKYAFGVLFTIIFLGCWFEFIKLVGKISPGKIGLSILTGIVYIALPILLIIYIRFTGEGVLDPTLQKVVPIGIIFSLWINDTMAYIGGSLFGKTHFTHISPNKTIEGTLIGILLCIGIMTTWGWLSGYLRVVDWAFISALSAIAGTFGDLMESKLKRMAGVKDSGQIMPGHGGFLDRFDSMLVAIPFVFIYWAVIIEPNLI